MSTDKRAWRARLRERRRAVPPSAAARAAQSAASHLTASSLWEGAQRIALYLPGDGEMATAPLVSAARSADLAVYLPAVEAGTLSFRLWEEGVALTANRYGIDEPPAHAPRGHAIDLLIAPLVGWSRSGYRLGMGGGYFDRYLAEPAHRPGFFLGLAYECQREDDLERLREPWDRNLEGVLTEKGLWRFAMA